MTATFSATQSQKSGTTSDPFSQIVTTEEAQKERVENEIAAMQSEKEEVLQAVNTKEQQAYDELKQEAKEELKKYGADELTGILSNAKDEADKECAKMKKAYKERKDAAVKELTKKILEPTFFTHSRAA